MQAGNSKYLFIIYPKLQNINNHVINKKEIQHETGPGVAQENGLDRSFWWQTDQRSGGSGAETLGVADSNVVSRQYFELKE